MADDIKNTEMENEKKLVASAIAAMDEKMRFDFEFILRTYLEPLEPFFRGHIIRPGKRSVLDIVCQMNNVDMFLDIICQMNNVDMFLFFLRRGITFHNNDRLSINDWFVKACVHNAYYILEILCLTNVFTRKDVPLGMTIFRRFTECTKVFLRNGIRLSAKHKLNERIEQEVIDYERGILSCRSIIVVLLGLKKRHIPALVRLDRFLIKQELAVAIWTTRDNEIWQSPVSKSRKK